MRAQCFLFHYNDATELLMTGVLLYINVLFAITNEGD